jgi:hypothetical protein
MPWSVDPGWLQSGRSASRFGFGYWEWIFGRPSRGRSKPAGGARYEAREPSEGSSRLSRMSRPRRAALTSCGLLQSQNWSDGVACAPSQGWVHAVDDLADRVDRANRLRLRLLPRASWTNAKPHPVRDELCSHGSCDRAGRSGSPVGRRRICRSCRPSAASWLIRPYRADWSGSDPVSSVS